MTHRSSPQCMLLPSLLLLSSVGCGGADVSQTDVPAPEPSVELTWLGGPTLSIEFNGLRIVTDPMFGEGQEA
ncbi:MAG: hypothetical protein KUG77_16425, partial [Nannocystaceae bacterium]|nr:hypothetical protein [Nannocystaceae bacterium]